MFKGKRTPWWAIVILTAAGCFEASNEVRKEERIKYGYIDKSGKMVIEPIFDYARAFHEQMAPVKVGSKWGYIDTTGNVVIEPQFDDAFRFNEGLALFKISATYNETRYLDINKKGKVIAESEYSEGLAVVKVGEKYGYIVCNDRNLILHQKK